MSYQMLHAYAQAREVHAGAIRDCRKKVRVRHALDGAWRLDQLGGVRPQSDPRQSQMCEVDPMHRASFGVRWGAVPIVVQPCLQRHCSQLDCAQEKRRS